MGRYATPSGRQGTSFPLGAALVEGGANFSVFAKHSTGAQLLLFDEANAAKPARLIDLDPRTNRTYHYWHVFVPGVSAGQIYAYRIAGPFDPERGLRFDPTKVLLDPYGKCIARPAGRSRDAACRPGDNAATALRSVVADPARYDWEGDAPLGRPFAKTIIYELPVGGFTRNPNSGVAPSSCCRSTPSTSRTGRLVSATIGATSPCPFLRRMTATARDPTRSARSTSFETWSRRCTAPGSRSSSTSSTTIPQRAAPMVPPCASADWRMKIITSCRKTRLATPTTPAAATR